MRRWVTKSPQETMALGESLAPELSPNGVLLLSGELGTGKTVLVQGLATGLGVDARTVQSPSYTLIVRHQAPDQELVHVDLYRLDPEETPALGLEEELAGPGVKAVEWAERLPYTIPGALRLALRRTRNVEEREILELDS